MTKTPHASPKPGRGAGSNGPTADDTLYALAQEIIDKEQVAAATDRRKANRVLYEAKGGSLAELDMLYKRREDPFSEIQAFFERQFRTFGAYFTDLQQFDLWIPKTTKSEAAGFSHAGTMAALKGEEGVPPPNLNEAERNDWMTGYDRGFKARAAGQKRLADTLAQAMANAAAGFVTDGTTGAAIDPNKRRPTKDEAKATAVGAQAKADFTQDQIDEAKRTGEITDDDPLGVGAEPPVVAAKADVPKVGQSDKAAAKRAAAGI